MKNNVIVHMTECKPQSTIASARVATFILATLPEFSLVDTETRCKDAVITASEMGLDNLIIVNGPMAFCDFLEPLAELVRMAKRVIWVQQDYTINPPSPNSAAESPFRKVFADKKLRPIYWTTVEKNVQTRDDSYVNWNQLTFEVQPVAHTFTSEPVLFYYGAFREKRFEDFNYWFKDTDYEVLVSTTPIRAKKFKLLDESIKIAPPFTSLGNMPPCSASLYIEDKKSHDEFHSPANRFYELLSAGIPIFFDSQTIKQLKKAGIEPNDEWVVGDKVELYRKLTTLDLIAVRNKQFNLWGHIDYVQLLQNQVNDAWRKLNDL